MNSDDDDRRSAWSYASPATPSGALQRGLGRGARCALVDPAGREWVGDCLRRDYRWDWAVDEREVYLGRLVRDLQLPVAPIISRLLTAESGEDNQFALSLGVIEVLGRAGVEGVVEEVRRCIRESPRWLDVLHTVAEAWPAPWWDDLYPQVIDRLDGVPEADILWLSPPWSRWAAQDGRIVAGIEAARHRPTVRRPFSDTPAETLLAMLRQPTHAHDWPHGLRELSRRPPRPDLLALVDELIAAGVTWPLAAAVEHLGRLALPAARQWVDIPDHPLAWTGWRLMAAHGDSSDVSRLLAGWDWLDARPDDLCGYDELAAGLARIGGPAAMRAPARIRRLWFSPHSYERARYLRALLQLDPPGAEPLLHEGLWDCESGVRLLAVQHATLDDLTRQRLQSASQPVSTANGGSDLEPTAATPAG